MYFSLISNNLYQIIIYILEILKVKLSITAKETNVIQYQILNKPEFLI